MFLLICKVGIIIVLTIQSCWDDSTEPRWDEASGSASRHCHCAHCCHHHFCPRNLVCSWLLPCLISFLIIQTSCQILMSPNPLQFICPLPFFFFNFLIFYFYPSSSCLAWTTDSFFTHLPASWLIVCSPRCTRMIFSHVHWASLPWLKSFIACRRKPTFSPRFTRPAWSDLPGVHSCPFLPCLLCLSHRDLWPLLAVLQLCQAVFCLRTFAQGFFDSSHGHLLLASGFIHCHLFRWALSDHTHSKSMFYSPLF